MKTTYIWQQRTKILKQLERAWRLLPPRFNSILTVNTSVITVEAQRQGMISSLRTKI
jgi:hypothetical protein